MGNNPHRAAHRASLRSEDMDNREADWAALHDPNTNAATLAHIAARYPEFAEQIATHPNCYPALREWAQASSTPQQSETAERAARRRTVSRRGVITAAAITGALAVTGAGWALIAAASGSGGGADPAAEQSSRPAPPSPTSRTTTPRPTPTPTPTRTATATRLKMAPLRTGAAIVIEPTKEYAHENVVLYSTQASTGVPISVGVRSNEKLRDVMWAVESDPDATPVAVAIVYISTEASGLNGTPDRLELRTFDATGELRSTVEAEGLTGIPAGFEGWYRDSAVDTAALFRGTLVVCARSSQKEWVLAGIAASTGARLWTTVMEDDLDFDIRIAPAQQLALFVREGTLYAVNPALGTVSWQTEGRHNDIETFPAAPFFHVNVSSGMGSNTPPSQFRMTATGAPFTLPAGYTSWAVDQLTGRLSLTWSDSSGGYPKSGPGFLVQDPDGSMVYTISADEARTVGGIGVLGAYDNRVWIRNTSGIDVVDSVSGARDPVVTAGSAPLVWVPAEGNRTWTLLATDVSTATSYRLVFHPDGPVPLADLGLYSTL